MNTQPQTLDIFAAAKSKIEKQFDTFDFDNPKVYELFKKFTFEALEAGHCHISADMVCHRIRWETNIETRSAGYRPDKRELKINNNYTAYYARKFMTDYPCYRGFFRTRIVGRYKTDKGEG